MLLVLCCWYLGGGGEGGGGDYVVFTLVVVEKGVGATLGAVETRLGLKQMMGAISVYRLSMRFVVVYTTPSTVN